MLPIVTDDSGVEFRVQRIAPPGDAVTWTVLDDGHRLVRPAEEFLEFLRVQGSSPNTVKSYARALALWWTYLHAFGLAWDALSLSDVGGFLAWLRSGDGPVVVPIEPRASRFAESTISTRLRAVTSCYRFHEMNGVTLGRDLVRVVHGGRAAYKPMLEHVARRKGRQRAVIRVRTARAAPPVLTPGQIGAICDACASPGTGPGQWNGRVRDRFLWSLLAETGLRLGEALSLQHRDWRTGRSDTPFIEVVPRDHPHGVRVKGGKYRRVFISDELDRLYGEYLWQLCEAGADLAVPDLDAAQVFVNLAGGTRFAPWRPGSVYDLVTRLRRDLAGQVPGAWSPHWMRHSHATALLLSGVPPHVVSRRLGHADVQTTLELYAHVTEDAELRAVAGWASFMAALAVRSGSAGRQGGSVLRNGGSGQLAGFAAAWGSAVAGVFAGSAARADAAAAVRRGQPPAAVRQRDLPWRRPRAGDRPVAACPPGCGRRRPGACSGSSRSAAWSPCRCFVNMLSLAATSARSSPTAGRTAAGRCRQFRWLDFPVPDLVPAGRARGAPPYRPASSPGDGTEPGQPAGPHDWFSWPSPGHRAVVAAGRLESRRGRPDPAARARADGTLHGAVRPDHYRVAAACRMLQWHCKTALETGTLTWSSVHHRVCSVRELDRRSWLYRQVTGPALADGPAAVRALMLEFLTRLRTRPSARGRRAGKPLSDAAVARTAGDIEQFYAHMAGSKDDAAAALGEPGWLALGPRALRLLPAPRASRSGPAPCWKARSSAPRR